MKPNVTEQQNALKAELIKAESINELISKQQQIIADANVLIDTAAPLVKQRVLLLAESATGIDHSKKITAIDADIATAEKSDSDHNNAKLKTINRAKETLGGLEQMLESINQSIAEQKRQLAITHNQLLNEYAEIEAQKYEAAAKQLLTSIKKFLALNALIFKVGIKKDTGFYNVSGAILVPQVRYSETGNISTNFIDKYTHKGYTQGDIDQILLTLGIEEL